MKSKNIKIAAGMVIIVAAIAYLIISSMSTATASYYTTVQEALAGKDKDLSKSYRIEGKIDVDHAKFDGTKTPVELTFDIYDEKAPNQKLHVVYNDVKPDNFKDATSAVVEGQFNPDGTFHAKTLMLKCPSKYEQQDQSQAQQDEGTVTKILKSLGLKS